MEGDVSGVAHAVAPRGLRSAVEDVHRRELLERALGALRAESVGEIGAVPECDRVVAVHLSRYLGVVGHLRVRAGSGVSHGHGERGVEGFGGIAHVPNNRVARRVVAARGRFGGGLQISRQRRPHVLRARREAVGDDDVVRVDVPDGGNAGVLSSRVHGGGVGGAKSVGDLDPLDGWDDRPGFEYGQVGRAVDRRGRLRVHPCRGACGKGRFGGDRRALGDEPARRSDRDRRLARGAGRHSSQVIDDLSVGVPRGGDDRRRGDDSRRAGCSREDRRDLGVHRPVGVGEARDVDRQNRAVAVGVGRCAGELDRVDNVVAGLDRLRVRGEGHAQGRGAAVGEARRPQSENEKRSG